MAEEIQNNVAPAETAEVKAEPVAAGEKSAAAGRGNGNRRFGQGGRRFNGRGNGRGRRVEEKLYDEKVVKISRVSKTVKGGKRVRFTALVVIGDGKGKYGYGLGKSSEVPDAIKKALAAAKRNMFKMTVAKGDTITHAVMGHFGATQVFLKPAPAAVRAILELAGIKNVYSKIYGSRTQNNVVKATVDALNQLMTYADVQAARFGKEVKAEAPKAEAK